MYVIEDMPFIEIVVRTCILFFAFCVLVYVLRKFIVGVGRMSNKINPNQKQEYEQELNIPEELKK